VVDVAMSVRGRELLRVVLCGGRHRAILTGRSNDTQTRRRLSGLVIVVVVAVVVIFMIVSVIVPTTGG